MPKLNSRLPKYRKHRQSGQAIVTLNGRDYLLGPHNTLASKAKYDRLVGEWLIQGGHTVVGQDEAGLTLVELASRYWTYAKHKYARGGKLTPTLFNIKGAKRYLLRLYADLPAANFGPLQLKVVRQAMIEQSGWSRNYLNEEVTHLARMFKWAVAEGLLPAAVHAALALVPGLRRGEAEVRETEKVMPVADEVVEATLPFLPQVVADMVRLQRLTGARPAEVCILRPGDVDRSGDVSIYRPMKHKTERHGLDRFIFIGPQGQATLFRYLARNGCDYCFCPRYSEVKRRAVLHANRSTFLTYGNRPGSNRRQNSKCTAGDCFPSESYRRAIARACDKAFPAPVELTGEKLKKWQSDHRWSPNQLRHSVITAIRKQFGLEAAQVILGHTAADVTQVYAERDLTKGLEVARRIRQHSPKTATLRKTYQLAEKTSHAASGDSV